MSLAFADHWNVTVAQTFAVLASYLAVDSDSASSVTASDCVVDIVVGFATFAAMLVVANTWNIEEGRHLSALACAAY